MHILDGVAASLIKYPEKVDIEVHGHTSSEGSDQHNLKLSQKRSQSVVNYLKLKGEVSGQALDAARPGVAMDRLK
jgi:OOP family OmpA-OmpF porin